MIPLSVNSQEVLKRRYLRRDDEHNVIETPDELFRRVASSIARAERGFRCNLSPRQAEDSFYRAMRSFEFLPNSPTLMNAGTEMGQLSACFVLPVEDSMDAIFESLKSMARIHQTGGGTGFSFSSLRPKGDLVSMTKGSASGPVSFMNIFDAATGVIVQGGRRRGANMGVLRCDHPDIIEFIEAKLKEGSFANFNLSVGVTDAFMRSVARGRQFALINPRTGAVARRTNAAAAFNLIAEAAWRTGDPGIIFLDEVNRRNPTPGMGRIEATNPCGELPLLPYESCNLGSINLGKFVRNGSLDMSRLKECVRLGIRFLDDVIEVNKFPLPQIRSITFANRKIGLGVMGFADMLIKLGVSYASPKAVSIAQGLMRVVRKESLAASCGLAAERGVFPNYKRSIYAAKGLRLRNATVNTIAPTGTISIIAGCSSGIEPLFAVSFKRTILSGTRLYEIHPVFEKTARSKGFYTDELLARISRSGSVRRVKGIPETVKKVFTTAFDVNTQQHLRVQAAFQKYTDNAVSKTINLSTDATVADVKNVFIRAYELGLKGITIYRYGSKKDQVLSFDYPKRRGHRGAAEGVVAESEYSGGCARGICPF